MADEEDAPPPAFAAVSDALSSLGVTTVETDVLLAFATAVETEMTTYSTEFDGVMKPFRDAELMVNFGGGGLVEGMAFQGPYGSCLSAMQEFAGDVIKGLTSLAVGSAVVATEYVAGDADSAAMVAAVNDAFAPPPLPTDPQVWANLAAHERKVEEQHQANEAAFEEQVDAAIRDVRGSEQGDDGDGEFEIPYSDYYDTNRPATIGPDLQDVNQFDLPGPEESVLDGVDLYALPTEQSEELQREIDAVHESLYTDDPPGTRHDVHG